MMAFATIAIRRAFRPHFISKADPCVSNSFHSSSKIFRVPHEKNLFTQSPFAKSDTIPFTDELVVRRELMEGNNAYGVRRYLLIHRNNLDVHDTKSVQREVIASINANKNVMFGLQLHSNQATLVRSTNVNFTEFLNTCGPLLDMAKEDASINGQQPQALCTLHGLCSWVRECINKNGEGSKVMGVLMNENSDQNCNLTKNTTDENDNEAIKNLNKSDKPRSKQRISNKSKSYSIGNETQRLQQLEAVTAIATNTPRPGHSVLGAGTYRDAEDPWIHLAWEYTQLSNPWDEFCRDGLEELMVYKSRSGEVSAIEHLAHREQGYLKSAGGAMARLFFV